MVATHPYQGTLLGPIPVHGGSTESFSRYDTNWWLFFIIAHHVFPYRGEWPPYWTTLVRSTYDQKKALGGFITRPYALSKCFVVFTMENWLKAGRTVSKPSVFSDTCAIFYLDKPQSFRNLFWTTPSSSRKVKYCINHHLTNSHLRIPTADGTNN